MKDLIYRIPSGVIAILILGLLLAYFALLLQACSVPTRPFKGYCSRSPAARSVARAAINEYLHERGFYGEVSLLCPGDLKEGKAMKESVFLTPRQAIADLERIWNARVRTARIKAAARANRERGKEWVTKKQQRRQIPEVQLYRYQHRV